MARNRITGTLSRKKGWFYTVIYYYDNDGKRRSKTSPTAIPTDENNARKAVQWELEATKLLDEAIRTFQIPTFPEATAPAEQLFTDTIKDWLKRQEGIVAPSTLAGYRYCCRDTIEYYLKILPLKTVDITSSSIESYFAWERRRRSPDYIPEKGERVCHRKNPDGSGVEATIQRRYAVIRMVLQDAKRDGIITINPASSRDSRIRPPKPQQPLFRVLSEKEVRKFLLALSKEPNWFQLAVLLGLLLGLRRSEVMALRYADIDWIQKRMAISQTVTQFTNDGQRTISIRPKTKNSRPKVFILSPTMLSYIEKMQEAQDAYKDTFGECYIHDWDDYIFVHPDGHLIKPDILSQRFRGFLKKNQLVHIRYHDLRHTCASLLYQRGASPKTIQRILGHTLLSTTMEIYTHLFGHETDEALLDLSDAFFPADSANPEIDGTFDGTKN